MDHKVEFSPGPSGGASWKIHFVELDSELNIHSQAIWCGSEAETGVIAFCVTCFTLHLLIEINHENPSKSRRWLSTELAGPSNVDPDLLRRTFIKCLTSYATIFLLGLQRSGVLKVYTIWMKRVGLWKRENLLVNSCFSQIRVTLMNYVSWGRQAETAPSLWETAWKITAEEVWTIFTTLLSSVMQANHFFFFFLTSSIFFHVDITRLYKPVFKNINKL